MILDQRSDIEQFFLESLEQVKEEKRRKIALATAQQAQMGIQMNGGQQQFLPLIDPKSKFSKSNFEKQQNSSMAEAQKQSQPQQVELSDLDWEDRERVLRLMFSKMNSGQPPTNWRQVEGGPLSAGGATSGGGITSTGRGGGLNQSFRENGEGEEDEEEDGYD